MAPTLVISDANVLIDMECGDLVATMFELDYRFAVPDVLYEMELRDHHPDLIALGLQVSSTSPVIATPQHRCAVHHKPRGQEDRRPEQLRAHRLPRIWAAGRDAARPYGLALATHNATIRR